MKRILCIALALTVAVGLQAGAARADSLYSDDEQDAHAIGLYGEHPPLVEIGDIIKVKIEEKTSADVELSVDTKDSFSLTSKVTRGAEKLLGRVLEPVFDLLGTGDFTHDAETQFKDDGKTDRSSRLDALVTALVVDKLESGNLVIEGRKQIEVNGEQQTMIVRGVIDPRDLSKDRVIESDYIADVEIEYLGEGRLSKRTKPGFLSRIIDFIF